MKLTGSDKMDLVKREPLRSVWPRLLILVICLVAAGPPAALAQFYFGKNKVQYADFQWRVMTTDHFRIYFYEDEQELAGIAAAVAEESYRPLAAKFNHEITKEIPLIIYSSPRFFAQTNVIPGLLPESVGGFTEFLKGRVVVPFNGSYADFAHVIRHELVHVFMISSLESAINRQPRSKYDWPPLWFIEGLAEAWSEEWDVEADMIVKDMVLANRLPKIEDLWMIRGSYFMYKVGQSICLFIEQEYGADKLTRIFENWGRARKFQEVVLLTLGEDLKELSRKWQYHLKKKYYPEIGKLDLPKMQATKLTNDGLSTEGVPIQWDDGSGSSDWLVFMANRMGYTGLYLKPRDELKYGLRTLLKGGRSSRFESLHLLRSGIDANDSGLIVFSSLSKERDYLYIYDLNKGKTVRRLEFPDLVTASSPRFSPDGRRIVFSGAQRGGYTDLYLIDVGSGLVTRLTKDTYYDIDPTFTPDGRQVVFCSDRGSDGPRGAVNLFRLDLNSELIDQLTYGPHRDLSPDATEKGIFFSSSRNGSYNIFLLDNQGEMTRQTAFVTGAFDPRLTADGRNLVFTGYEGMTYSVYQMRLKEKVEPVATTMQQMRRQWQPRRIDSRISTASVRYNTDYSFDIAQSMVAYDPVYGGLGGVQGMISDMLGNHAIHFVVNNTADSQDELLESFNVGVTYINREHRMNWGIGAFHLYNDFYNDADQFFDERQAGGFGLLSYPFSKFMRVDLATFARYTKKDRRYGLLDREGFIVTHQISWVYDNSLWEHSGPIEGRRYNLSLGISSDLTSGQVYNRLAWVDIRHYYRLGKSSALANRLFWFSSGGLEPQRIYFGGSWSFRGYSRRFFYARNVAFSSTELRFPLIDNLFIGLPIGDLGFQAIRGALFFDVGSVWENQFRKPDGKEWLGSYGAGVRVGLGYLVLLRFDFSQRTDFYSVDPHIDFDFFFGWNF